MRKENFVLNREYIIFIFLIFIMLVFAVGKRENSESKYKNIMEEKILNDEKIEKLVKDISKKQEELENAQLELVKLKKNSKENIENKLGKIKIINFNDEIEMNGIGENKNRASLNMRENMKSSKKKIEIDKKISNLNENNIKSNNFIENQKLSLDKSNLVNRTLNLSKIKNYKILWPVESEIITSQFGDRYHPVLKQMKFHRGVDIGAKKGETVKASFNGIVTFAGEKGEYGYMVELERDDGLKVRYAHLDKIEVVTNQLVSEGEKIGEVGSTGMTTGDHLHFEIIIESVPVDPMRFKYFR